MKKFNLVFVPVPAPSHLQSAIQFAKLLIEKDERLSITFIVILLPNQLDLDPQSKSLAAGSDNRIEFIIILANDINPFSKPPSSPTSFEKLAILFIESHKSEVEQEVLKLLSKDDSIHLSGFVLDLFCTSIIDVAEKFSVPSYIFFTSNTAFLGFLLHLPNRHKEVGVEFNPSDQDSIFPSFVNRVPTSSLPSPVFDKTGGGYESFLYFGTRFYETKGIIVNSFVELEPYAVNSIRPPLNVYTAGPLIKDDKLISTSSSSNDEIINWLDNQPSKSVIFLCFGTMGSFNEDQVKQIAIALEKSNHRFLWSIREPPQEGTHGSPSEYENIEKVLPDGFLGRVKERGMVCGYAPQVKVLAHDAVNGFVSHCGWNSILESLWYGVPIATWPLNAEQQMNAFLLVKEWELGVELSLSYRSGGGSCKLVMADQIAKAVRCLMDDENPVREKVKKISEKSRKALINDGSSFSSIGKFLQDMQHNIGEK